MSQFQLLLGIVLSMANLVSLGLDTLLGYCDSLSLGSDYEGMFQA